VSASAVSGPVEAEEPQATVARDDVPPAVSEIQLPTKEPVSTSSDATEVIVPVVPETTFQELETSTSTAPEAQETIQHDPFDGQSRTVTHTSEHNKALSDLQPIPAKHTFEDPRERQTDTILPLIPHENTLSISSTVEDRAPSGSVHQFNSPGKRPRSNGDDVDDTPSSRLEDGMTQPESEVRPHKKPRQDHPEVIPAVVIQQTLPPTGAPEKQRILSNHSDMQQDTDTQEH
jgi:hypothetical protein